MKRSIQHSLITVAIAGFPAVATADVDAETVLQLCSEPLDSLQATVVRFDAAGWREITAENIDRFALFSAQAMLLREMTRYPAPDGLSHYMQSYIAREVRELEQSLVNSAEREEWLQLRVSPDGVSAFLRMTRDYDNNIGCLLISLQSSPRFDSWGNEASLINGNATRANPEYVSIERRRLPFDSNDSTGYSASFELLRADVHALRNNLNYPSDVQFALFVTSQQFRDAVIRRRILGIENVSK